MPCMDLGLAGRACIVTGASRGIGLATARGLCAEGADVLLVARDPDALGEAAAACAAEGGRAIGVGLDVTAPDAGDRAVEACRAAFDVPWALVNNAGITRARPLEELEDADWQAQWDVHVMASMRMMRAAAPAMADAGGGRVVNVTSSAAKRPSSTTDPSYSVTKAAQQSLSRVFADVYAARGVLVNAVAPGAVAGSMWLTPGGLGRRTRPPRPHGGRGRDRGGHSLPVLGAGIERGGRGLVGRRRHRADDLLNRRGTEEGPGRTGPSCPIGQGRGRGTCAESGPCRQSMLTR
jgi:3-oxoacyl-[acyl-carrier protein] reductase